MEVLCCNSRSAVARAFWHPLVDESTQDVPITVDGQKLHHFKYPKLWELWYIPYNG